MRLLLADHPQQSTLAKKLFAKAEANKIFLWTTDIVFLEIIWTLTSYYQLKLKEVQNKVSSLLGLKNLKVKNKDLLLQALDLAATNKVDFADAYNFLLAQKEKQPIISFDKDFDKLGKRENIKKIF